MRKLSTLLATTAIAMPMFVAAQAPLKPVASSEQMNRIATYGPVLEQLLKVEDPNMMKARPYGTPQRQVISQKGSSIAVAPVALGTSSNSLTARRGETNQVINVDSLGGLIAFIHRQDVSIWGGGGTDNGKFRYDVSTDGGLTFNNDIGVLQQTYTNYGRYPNITAYNPGITSNPFDAKFAYCAPTNRFPTPGWIGHVVGVSDVTTSGTPAFRTDNYVFDAENTLLPGGLCQGLPGEFWYTDFQYDGTNVMDSVQLYKGTYNTATGDIDWILAHKLVPGYDISADGSINAVGPNIAFSPDGMTGWCGLLSNIGSDPNNGVLFPVFFKSTDGGDTWSAPMEVNLDAIPWIADSLQSLWTDSTGAPAGSGLATCGFDYDMTVDNGGNVHLAVVIGNAAAGTPFSIGSGLAKFIGDIHTVDGGATWQTAYIAPVLAFRGTFGSANPATMDNFVQVARDEAGSIVFYSWADSDTAQFTGNMTGLGFGESDNLAPNLRIAARRVFDGAMPYPKIITDGDLVWDGRMLFPTMSPIVRKDGCRYELPIVGLEFLQNDPNLETAFYYFGKDAFFELCSASDWCDPANMELGWSSWGFTGAAPACLVGNEQPIAGPKVVLHQSFPNPTAGNALIRFDLPTAGSIEMDLVNMYGQQIGTLASGEFSAGVHDVTVETSSLAAGVYFYNLRANGEVLTQKMIVTK
jgi:Secretion system C-terminal sorting domain